MIVQPMSDIHLDFHGSRGFPPLADGVSLVLVAGDICPGLVRAIEALRDAYPETEVALVAGNHEFHGRCHADELAAGRERARQLGVSLLENDMAIFGGLRVIAATGWTDYELFGQELRDAAMRSAAERMRDHKRITWRKNPWHRFRPQEARALHMESRRYIEGRLAEPHRGATLVMTHHACTLDAVMPTKQRSLISAAYSSELLPIVDRYKPDWWLSGHTHVSMRLVRGLTRLISNPVGYPGENPFFDPRFTIEVSDA